MEMTMNIAEEVAQIKMERPHVVILGAGASIAATFAFGGDKNGKKLPGMIDFVEVLKLEGLLRTTDVSFAGVNFEEVYDALYREEKYEKVRGVLEVKVHNYFSTMELPESPTLYDELILSLREKDVVATFNWDPFLVQALQRNRHAGFKPPRLIFLHGNVLVGYCSKDEFIGRNGNSCPECGKILTPSKLLYPIKDKDYVSNEFIKNQWDTLEDYLHNAFMVTVLGYGAPSSDTSAMNLMKLAYGNPSRRNMKQFEVINILSEEELHKTWSPFIHSHHYEIHRSFQDSWIGKHPRRSGEAYWNQYMDAKFIDDNPRPDCGTLPELWAWFQQFKMAEDAHKAAKAKL